MRMLCSKRTRKTLFRFALLSVTTIGLLAPQAWGMQDSEADNSPGELQRKANRYKRSLTIAPKKEARPALQVQFLPDLYDSLPGNSALFYYKALSPLDNDFVRETIAKTKRDAEELAKEQKTDLANVPPYSYLTMPPKEYPVDEVREYLKTFDFQKDPLHHAWLRPAFSMDRSLKESKNPNQYDLSEIRPLQELAKTQSIRFRLAIREGRSMDAIAILGQQFQLARHLGQDELLVSNLGGMSIAAIAWFEDAFFLSELEGCPNLYWAIATLPNPLVQTEHGLRTAYHENALQFKFFNQIDESVRGDAFWEEVIREFATQTKYIEDQRNIKNPGDGISDTDFGPPLFIGSSIEERVQSIRDSIEGLYEDCHLYLQIESSLSAEQISRFSKTQTVFLAMKLRYTIVRDELFKWNYLPAFALPTKLWGKVVSSMDRTPIDRKLNWFTRDLLVFPSFLLGSSGSQLRTQQGIAGWMVVEALRDYAAKHNNQLPESLDQLDLVPPHDPVLGAPFHYSLKEGEATITYASITVPSFNAPLSSGEELRMDVATMPEISITIRVRSK